MLTKRLERMVKKAGWKKYTNPFIYEFDYDKDEHWHNTKKAKYPDWVCQCYRRFPELDCDPRYDLEEIINEMAMDIGKRVLKIKGGK